MHIRTYKIAPYPKRFFVKWLNVLPQANQYKPQTSVAAKKLQLLGCYIASKFTTRWIRSENTKLVAKAWGLQMRPKAPYYYIGAGKVCSGGCAAREL